MRPEGIRKALLQAGEKSSIVHLNDGSQILVKNREHWLIGEEFLVVETRKQLHCVAFRNITSIEIPARRRSRSRSA